MMRNGMLVLTLGVIVWVGRVAAAAEAASTQPQDGVAASRPAGEIELAAQYVDLANGFSLRPPMGATVSRVTSPTQIVSWVRRDEKTQAIEWTITMEKLREGAAIADMKAYAKGVQDKLVAGERFEPQSLTVGTLAGKGMFDLRGLKAGGGFWQRQLWVENEPGKLLVLSITGPSAATDRLQAIFSAVVASLKLIDPQAALASRKENLDRGKEFLAGLTAQKYSAVINDKPQFFLLKMKSKPVGYLVRQEGLSARKSGSEGYWASSVVFINLEGSRTLKETLFLSADGQEETWVERLSVGEAGRVKEHLERGTRQKEEITCDVTPMEGQPYSLRTKIPAAVYLSKVTGALLPKLLDLSRPTSYAFLTYDSQNNLFNTRTFTIEGKEQIEIGGAMTAVIRASDQGTVQAEPSILRLDDKGNVLRLVSPEGLTIESTGRDEVAKLYPQVPKALSAEGD